jgi:hypothetical protein
MTNQIFCEKIKEYPLPTPKNVGLKSPRNYRKAQTMQPTAPTVLTPV